MSKIKIQDFNVRGYTEAVFFLKNKPILTNNCLKCVTSPSYPYCNLKSWW